MLFEKCFRKQLPISRLTNNLLKNISSVLEVF